jgi:hypothetical protein
MMGDRSNGTNLLSPSLDSVDAGVYVTDAGRRIVYGRNPTDSAWMTTARSWRYICNLVPDYAC